jgi:hypothetical protein
VLDLSHRDSAALQARLLLRKLRDLNLDHGPIAITRQRRATLAGCSSLDAPAESGVRYRVRFSDGSHGLLELAGATDGLHIRLEGAVPDSPRSLGVRLSRDRQGRICAPALAARVTLRDGDRRELEHFLRRVVRTLGS